MDFKLDMGGLYDSCNIWNTLIVFGKYRALRCNREILMISGGTKSKKR